MTSKHLALAVLMVVIIAGAIQLLNPSIKHYDDAQKHEHRFDSLTSAVNKCAAEGQSSVIDTDACQFRCSATWSQAIAYPVCAELNKESSHL